ncbi:MAG TPA: hypothetical protein VEO55_04695 [Candidatus Dormibacteraeota bacterium]|nr:hypothetical protein [Candidatus Dormibacteraeota bacterium]
MRLGTELRHGHAFLIGDIAEQGAVAAGDRDQADAALVLVGTNFRSREQSRRVDQIVEVVDDDRAMLFEKCIPCGGGAGELTGVGDDVALGALGASRA